MIGFNHLGVIGRLGNQMFQYATLRGIADEHGYEFTIPESDFQMSGTITSCLMHSNFLILRIEESS